MTDPQDDPVIAAVAMLRGITITLPPGCNTVTIQDPATDDPRDATVLTFIAAQPTAGEHADHGYACAAFAVGGELVHYYNGGGTQDVRMAGTALPLALATAARGRPLREVVDIPGIGDRIIAEVLPEEAFGRWILRLSSDSAEGTGR